MRKVNKELTAKLAEALALLPVEAVKVFATTKVAVCNVRRGFAKCRDRVVTIPAFAFNETVNFCGKGLIPGGVEFVAYYLAHELAHIKAQKGVHGRAFYDAFKVLCPERLQHYELVYKPIAAKKFGVQQKGA